jgi:phosphonate transport system substrate-binding protein
MVSASIFRAPLNLAIAGLTAAGLLAAGSAAGAECARRGDLDVRFCDADGDLLADTPAEPGRWLDPKVLVFSYTPAEDPAVYQGVFSEFIAHLADKTGRKVKWYAAESYAAQVEAMRSGRLHIAGVATGPTVYGVNLAGYIPFALMTKDDGSYGYRLQLITHKGSGIRTVKDLKGRKVAHVTPSSNSGNQAPRALFKAMGVVPDKDYKVIYSGKHDNSIMGVVNRDYDAAPIADAVLKRMVRQGVLKRDVLRVIWQSRPFPPTSYGYVYNLRPEMQKKVREAFLTFDWKGSGLAKEFAPRTRFSAISYKDAWRPIRLIQKQNNVVYTKQALQRLKTRKKRRRKKKK